MTVKRLVRRTLPKEKERYFREVLDTTRANSRFDEMGKFIQHGATTVKEHCINVAYTAYFISEKYNIKVDSASLIRGALLHDYFLYDWHEKSWANSIHGYTHPKKALRNAERDFELNNTERDMIAHHMFPLTIFPPKTREGLLLCIADKIVATKETIGDRLL